MAPSTRNGPTAAEIREMIAAEVARAVNDAMPDMVTALRDQLGEMIAEQIAAIPQGQTQQRGFSYKEFSACNPPEFKGSVDPIVCMNWLKDVEGAFITSGCPEDLRVRFTRNLLRDGAKNWWENWTTSANMTEAQITNLTWEEFRTRFRERFVPRVETDRIAREFLALEQTTESVPEFSKKFLEMALFCPEYAANEEMKMSRYRDMLRVDIRKYITHVRCATLTELMEVARYQEIELEKEEKEEKKRKATQAPSGTTTATKRPKVFNGRPRGNGSFRTNDKGTFSCFKCGKEGHLGKDCRSSAMVCFNCGKAGHIRPNCPEPRKEFGNKALPVPNNAPLRITDGRTGAARTASTARTRVYQISAEEAQSTPTVVAGNLNVHIMYR